LFAWRKSAISQGALIGRSLLIGRNNSALDMADHGRRRCSRLLEDAGQNVQVGVIATLAQDQEAGQPGHDPGTRVFRARVPPPWVIAPACTLFGRVAFQQHSVVRHYGIQWWPTATAGLGQHPGAFHALANSGFADFCGAVRRNARGIGAIADFLSLVFARWRRG
jgi:hypothetical protein